METNKYKRVWIWFWYNDITRICILLGVPLIPVAVALMMLGVHHETIRAVLACVYVLLFAWMLVDNDYSNLRRIGMDEYRRKL